MSFLKESTNLMDVKLLKLKDEALALLKNYRALREKQSGFQLRVFHLDERGEYMQELHN